MIAPLLLASLLVTGHNPALGIDGSLLPDTIDRVVVTMPLVPCKRPIGWSVRRTPRGVPFAFRFYVDDTCLCIVVVRCDVHGVTGPDFHDTTGVGRSKSLVRRAR